MMELSELVDLISSCSSSGQLLVLGGDLNCEPDTLEMDLFRVRLPQLMDAWATAAERSGGSGGTDGSGSNPKGLTCHAPGNTYLPRRQVAERIDYIWSNMSCKRAEVALQMTPAGWHCYHCYYCLHPPNAVVPS
jgi:endonuclease/exonuclease/phosphatase family metal-dependent hydrolase